MRWMKEYRMGPGMFITGQPQWGHLLLYSHLSSPSRWRWARWEEEKERVKLVFLFPITMQRHCVLLPTGSARIYISSLGANEVMITRYAKKRISIILDQIINNFSDNLYPSIQSIRLQKTEHLGTRRAHLMVNWMWKIPRKLHTRTCTQKLQKMRFQRRTKTTREKGGSENY